MAVTGEENIYFEMESKQEADKHTYELLAGKSSAGTVPKSQTSPQECRKAVVNKRQPSENEKAVWRLLLIIAVIVFLSFLAIVATLVVAFAMIVSGKIATSSTDMATVRAEQENVGNGLCPEVKLTLSQLTKEIRALNETLSSGSDGNGLFCKVKQPLTELKDDIRTLKENLTAYLKGCGEFSHVRQPLTKMKDDIIALKENLTAYSEICGKQEQPGGKLSQVQQQLNEIKDEIREVKLNLTGDRGEDGLFSEMKHILTELKQEIRALKENLTGGPRGDGIFSEIKQQLTEIQKSFHRVQKENQTSNCKGVYKNCAQVFHCGHTISGVYKIDPDGLGEFEVYCDQTTAGGGWTVFQKRQDGSVDFYRRWDEYKRGFGNLKEEFWLGLDKINRLTASSGKKLRVDLERNGQTTFAEYSSFAVSNELAKYKLSLGNYTGTTGDSLKWFHQDHAFSTKDRDNDKSTTWNCAMRHSGAWWYNGCCTSNLNGLYLNQVTKNDRGIWWSSVNDYTTFTKAEMKMQPNN